MKHNILILSYYLPQFHAIPENNEWWGEGFTEWVALRKAEPHFSWQTLRRPIMPLSEYNLLDPIALQQQAGLARKFGVDAFFVWDYWFGRSRQLLQKPMELVLAKAIDFPYCFIWANHSWYDKSKSKLLMEQKYLGRDDYQQYFDKCLPHFRSKNYLLINGAPVLGIFRPQDVPDLDVWVETMRCAARVAGFPAIFLIAENTPPTAPWAIHFDKTINSNQQYEARKLRAPLTYVKEQLLKRCGIHMLGPLVYDYSYLYSPQAGASQVNARAMDTHIPTVISGWDTTPRHGRRGTIYQNFSTEHFEAALSTALRTIQHQISQRFVVIKSWNEWAEGNVLEPDSIYDTSLLEAVRRLRLEAEQW